MNPVLQKITRKVALDTIQTMIESGNSIEDINVALGETIFKLKKGKKVTEFVFVGYSNTDVLMKTYFEMKDDSYTLVCVDDCISFDNGYCVMYKTSLENIISNEKITNSVSKDNQWLRCQGCKVANKK